MIEITEDEDTRSVIEVSLDQGIQNLDNPNLGGGAISRSTVEDLLLVAEDMILDHGMSEQQAYGFIKSVWHACIGELD